jgi:uncharacterized membrane protein
VTSDIWTIARGDASRILQRQRLVARTEREWRAVWAAHAGPGSQAPPVDFGSRMVVAAFQGERPSAGFGATIVGASADGPVLTVQIDERPPENDRMVAQVLVSPFHIVSMPRLDGDVRFADVRVPDLQRADGDVQLEDLHDRGNEVTQAAPAPTRHDATTRITESSSAVPSLSSSSTGLAPETAGALAYLAGPLSGALLLIVERTSKDVRFHAWQALLGLGTLGLTAVGSLGLAFLMLIVSPRVFSAMRWLAAIAACAWVALWAICLIQAYKGRRWKIPVAGAYAERFAGR